MITFFTEKDLVSFGEYLLSQERTTMILEHPEFKDRTADCLQSVYEADLANWISKGNRE